MRWVVALSMLGLAGCSTAPVTNLMDHFHPSRPFAPDDAGSHGRRPEPKSPPPGIYPPEILGEPLPGR